MNNPTSLLPYNTFGLAHSCSEILHIDTIEALQAQCLRLHRNKEPMLVLGGGSNIVLTDDFSGTVVLIETHGIEIKAGEDAYYLTVAAGENWHDLVLFCLAQGIPGLENMALIPGTVGAAPIQNIGAYGVEFCQACDWVEYLDLDSGKLVRLSAEQCQFGYRDSVFKQALKNKAVITQVGLKLVTPWRPQLSYGPLKGFSAEVVTPQEVFDTVCQIRRSKLPDPHKLGNAGSFFKNPVVTVLEYQRLAQNFPDTVGYALEDGRVKLAAGWLIERAGLKGYEYQGAAVHNEQALVLVNLGSATGQVICDLARHIITEVNRKFGVVLEPEPRLIGLHGEVELANA
ncbi:UDP-N-acetylmuramate dehydrogenase [Shewanella sp. NFH-SH190041]|uniref:UDP-N-acetylmuramate dehydrogenase n=1 Tax=Shewanella sp. NFH-SH190041 TaxID=2950245 RepID=UPI0021C3C20A|nr:UDP-N-acetylmuramate dehydrogenase [Shewanella sp. NFH-SH190041]